MRKRVLSAAAIFGVLAMASAASAQRYQVTIDAGARDRQPTVMSVTVPDLKPNPPRFLGHLTSADGKEKIQVQFDVEQDAEGRPVRTRASWIQPAIKAGESRSYTLQHVMLAYDTTPYFHFVEGQTHRDLYFNDKPVYRYVNHYDPADHANTMKPFHEVFGFHGEGPITKGTGGSFPHHRGLFFGYKTEYGDFWHNKDSRQQHTGFRFESETNGPVTARAVSTVDWVDKSGTAVARDTRDVNAYRLSDDALLLDFDITVENLTDKPLDLKGDPQHAGFHFRAAQEVADAKPADKAKSTTAGGATYVRPPSAKFTRNDEWVDCPWVACNFTVKGNPYTVVHMDHPANPKPATYSTRPYGRFGPFSPTTVQPGQPLTLKYRVAILDGKVHAGQSAEQLAAWYADYVEPANVTIRKQ